MFVGVLLTASIVLALTQREDEFAEGTPERAVQRFLIAARDQDFSTAHALLSEARRQECPIEDLIGTPYGGKQDLENSRVTLEDTKDLDDGGAVVIARVTRISSSGPFGTSESSSERRFTLSQEDGEWRLTGGPLAVLRLPAPTLAGALLRRLHVRELSRARTRPSARLLSRLRLCRNPGSLR